MDLTIVAQCKKWWEKTPPLLLVVSSISPWRIGRANELIPPRRNVANTTHVLVLHGPLIRPLRKNNRLGLKLMYFHPIEKHFLKDLHISWEPGILLQKSGHRGYSQNYQHAHHLKRFKHPRWNSFRMHWPTLAFPKDTVHKMSRFGCFQCFRWYSRIIDSNANLGWWINTYAVELERGSLPAITFLGYLVPSKESSQWFSNPRLTGFYIVIRQWNSKCKIQFVDL